MARIPLTALAPEIRRLTGRRTTYRALYNRVLNGDLPAALVNGRWEIDPDDMPVIVERLGLPMAAPRQHVAA